MKKHPQTPTIKREENKWQLSKKYMNLTLTTDIEQYLSGFIVGGKKANWSKEVSLMMISFRGI